MLSAPTPTAEEIFSPPPPLAVALAPKALAPTTAPLMWRRLPTRRLAFVLLSAPPSQSPHPPLHGLLLPVTASGILPHPRFLWERCPRFASSSAVVAETVFSEEVEELHHALEEIVRVDPNPKQPSSLPAAGEVGKERRGRSGRGKQTAEVAAAHGMGYAKYAALRRRQVRIETEAWEQAAKEYRELLADMCEHKLAPNLPYVKSLFLGWFEPLRDQIITEQEVVGVRGARASHAPYFNMLPADMMAVITMHKLMGLLMTGSCDGSVRVIQAACQIGEA